MTQPVAYTRIFDFTGYQASNPSTPLPGNQVDAELNALKLTTDQIRTNLAIIQRDDTLLGNATVHPDAFTTASQALIAGSAGWAPKGAWLTATSYAVKDFVSNSGSNYVCVTAHTSGTFATDLAAGKWQITLNLSSASAILRDGSTSPSANIPWNNFKITGLADGTLAQDAVTVKQAQQNALEWGGISTGAAGNFAVTLSPAPGAYVAGMVVRWQAHQAGAGGDVINVNALGNKPLKKNGAVALVASDIPNGAIIEAELDATLTNFQILSVLGNNAVLGANTFTALQTYNVGASTLANVLIGTTAGAALGPTLEVQRAITGGAGNLLGTVDFTGQSSTSVARTFCRVQGKIITATNGAEDGEIEFWNVRGGTVANRMNIGAGLWSPNASGGDKGADSINVLTYYKNGAVFGLTTPITSKSADYGLLAADVGGLFKMNSASPHTFTLLSGATAGNGGQINFESVGAGICTITRAGSDTIASGGSQVLTSITLAIGDKGYLVSDGGSPAVWTWFGSRHYDSGQQAITAAGALTLPHGLGVQPLITSLVLHCVTGELGYSAGDEVNLTAGQAEETSTNNRGVNTKIDATNLTVRFGNVASSIALNSGSSGSAGSITNANWTIIWRAVVLN